MHKCAGRSSMGSNGSHAHRRHALQIASILTAIVLTIGDAGGVWESSSCWTESGVDYSDSDILPTGGACVDNVDECCDLCKNYTSKGCLFFTFDTKDACHSSAHIGKGALTCYLKTGDKGRKRFGNRISGTIGPEPAPVPPGPAPTPASPVHPNTGLYACQPPDDKKYDFCDATKTVEERVALLVANLTAEEMVGIVKKSGVSRLGIPSYNMWAIEALHGVRLWPEKCPFPDKCTTIFPPASASARAFNRTLWKAIGRAMGDEGRVLFNLGIISDLSLRGPQLNLQRDPRWGRNTNSPSEDPLLCGEYGKGIVAGMQGESHGTGAFADSRYWKVASEMKHWTAYGVENGRMGFNGVGITLHDLSDSYFKPLKMCLEVNISSAMCAYDAINGVPSCANSWMNDKVLRQTWGFDGVIESDCGAISNIEKQFHYTHDGPHTAAAGMAGTCDVECDHVYSSSLQAAVDTGLVNKSVIAASARRILTHRFKLGFFDDMATQPYVALNDSGVVHSNEHVATALSAAHQSIVLLQNPTKSRTHQTEGRGDEDAIQHEQSGASKILPLSPGSKVLVIGPNANLTDAFIGDYRPAACAGTGPTTAFGNTWCQQTALMAITQRNGDGNGDDNVGNGITLFAAGGCVDGPPCTKLDATALARAVSLAESERVDAVVVVQGLKTTDDDNDENTNGEGRDRGTIALPGIGMQANITAAMLAVGKPVVLALLTSGSVSVDAAYEHPNAAVISVGFGGEVGARALADVIFGAVNPSARLTHTMYREVWGRATDMRNMSLLAGLGRSYRYLGYNITNTTTTTTSTTSTTSTATAAAAAELATWQFGDGLSFTQFSLALASTGFGTTSGAPMLMPLRDATRHSLTVRNIGDRPGADTVLLYFQLLQQHAADRTALPVVPNRQLMDFQGLELAAGATGTVSFSVSDSDLALVDADGSIVVVAGDYQLLFSDGSSNVTLKITVPPTSARVLETLPPGAPPAYPP